MVMIGDVLLDVVNVDVVFVNLLILFVCAYAVNYCICFICVHDIFTFIRFSP